MLGIWQHFLPNYKTTLVKNCISIEFFVIVLYDATINDAEQVTEF